jgi:hypothetical protein
MQVWSLNSILIAKDGSIRYSGFDLEDLPLIFNLLESHVCVPDNLEYTVVPKLRRWFDLQQLKD